MNKKLQTAIKASVIACVVVLASGCTISQNRLDQLETKVGLLEQEVAAANSAAAQQAAEAAQATADEALAAAAENAACCDATNEKIDRMFQRSQSK
ncbi:MAG: Lpp/OprI family alanine-zipper lipoprotein [Gammaproteobacteria bacterium]|jgi:septal ring factor EnvC (AmiA/AmiB activator)|nr:Lpp/OprI family alanine-zipper lipoprotein [Gammaproteobacteria bacterium]